jgi:hypothetical protein
MRLLIVFLVCVVGIVYFNSSHAANLPNSTKVEETLNPFVLDIDIDCDFNPDTNEVYNCKVVEKTNEK